MKREQVAKGQRSMIDKEQIRLISIRGRFALGVICLEHLCHAWGATGGKMQVSRLELWNRTIILT